MNYVNLEEIQGVLDMVETKQLNNYMAAIYQLKNSDRSNQNVSDDSFYLSFNVDYLGCEVMYNACQLDIKGFKNEFVAKNFPVPQEFIGKKMSVNVCFLHPGTVRHYASEALESMKIKHLQPANVFELMALGCLYPKFQLVMQIVALGSQWNDNIPILGQGDNRRGLSLSPKDKEKKDYLLSDFCYYMAVKNCVQI